jgi:hypothetical protein
VAEYLGDDPRTVLKIYAHILSEGQRRDFVRRLGDAETAQNKAGHYRGTNVSSSAKPAKNTEPSGFGI